MDSICEIKEAGVRNGRRKLLPPHKIAMKKAIRAVRVKEDQLWKRKDESVKAYIQDSDIQKLASEFAGIASEEFAKNIDGIKMVMDRRECGRFVREVQQ